MNPSHWLSWLTRFVRWHRRGLGILCAGLCLLSILSVLSPSSPPSRQVVVVASPLAAGASPGAQDLSVQQIPLDYLPQNALSSPDQAIGKLLAAPQSQGSILTTDDFVNTELIDQADGQNLVPFRVSDTGVAGMLSVGMRISVVGTGSDGQSVTLAQRVRIAALPENNSTGAFGGSSSGALIVVAAPSQIAKDLAAASTRYALSIVLEPDS